MSTIKKPDMTNCTEKQFNSWYWSDFNETCKKCVNKCKQSHAVKLSCPSFESQK
jgi:hypothetical protein